MDGDGQGVGGGETDRGGVRRGHRRWTCDDREEGVAVDIHPPTSQGEPGLELGTPASQAHPSETLNCPPGASRVPAATYPPHLFRPPPPI